MGISDKKKLLLYKGMKNGGTVTIEQATGLYSTNQAGKSAVQSLMYNDYLEYKKPGVFKVVGAPQETIDKYKKWKENNSERSDNNKD